MLISPRPRQDVDRERERPPAKTRHQTVTSFAKAALPMRNLFFLFGPSNRGRRRGARTNQVRARGIESSVSVWNASSGYAKLAKLITAKATLRCSYANDAPPSPPSPLYPRREGGLRTCWRISFGVVSSLSPGGVETSSPAYSRHSLA